MSEGADDKDVDSGEKQLDLVNEGGEDTLDVGDDLNTKEDMHVQNLQTLVLYI